MKTFKELEEQLDFNLDLIRLNEGILKDGNPDDEYLELENKKMRTQNKKIEKILKLLKTL